MKWVHTIVIMILYQPNYLSYNYHIIGHKSEKVTKIIIYSLVKIDNL